MDYDVRAAKSAAKALAPKSKGGKGADVTIYVPSVGKTFDPNTQAMTGGGAPVAHLGSGLVMAYDVREIDGTKIKTADRKLMLSALKQDGSAMPTFDTKATALVGGVKYSVMRCDPFQPAGDAVIYFDVQLRGPA